MQNKIKKIITGAVLSLSAVALLLLFTVTQATAAALAVNTAGDTTIGDSDDTVDASSAGAVGNVARNIIFNQAHSTASTPLLTITGAGTVNFGTFVMTLSDNAGDRAGITVGNGAADTVLIFNGAVTGVAAANSVAADLDLIIGALSGSAGASTVKLYGTTDAIGISMTGDANGVATLQLGDGTTGMTSAAIIDMSPAADVSVLDIMKDSTQSGAIQLSSATASVSVTINMAAGTTLSGAIADAAEATLFRLNVNGDVTLSAAIDAGSTTDAGIVVADTFTVTATGTGAWAVDTITLAGTSILKLDGAKSITGTINGVTSASGTIDVNADTTLVSAIGGSVPIATIDIAAFDLTTSAAVTATTINFSADGSIIPAGIITASGGITTAADNTGTVTTGGDAVHVTTIGSIASGGNKLALVTAGHDVTFGAIGSTIVDVAAVKTLTLTGSIVSTTTRFSADGFIVLCDGCDITGNVTETAGGASNGTLTTGGPLTSTVDGNIGEAGKLLKLVAILGDDVLEVKGDLLATSTTIAAGGKLIISPTDNTSTLTATTATGATEIDIGTTTVSATGTVAWADTTGSKFAVTIGAVDGTLTGAGTVTFPATASNMTVVPTIEGAVVSGEALTIASEGAGTIIVVPGNVTDNYERYNFAVAQCNTRDVCLTATVVAPAGVSGAGVAVNKVADVAFAADSGMADALNGVSGAVLDRALKSLAPAVDGGAIVGAVSAGGAASNTISTQMASLRTGIAAGQGINAGDGSEDHRFWTQGFGAYGEQKIRQGIGGFTSTTGGLALGIDKRVQNNLILGGAYSFAHTDVNAAESLNTTDIQSHQATLYGSLDLGKSFTGVDGMFLDAQLSYAHNDYDGNRHILVGAVERQAKGDYTGHQIASRLELGRTFNLSSDYRFTPSLGLAHSRVEIDNYTETGATTANLTVSDQTYDILSNTVKAKVARTWQVNGLDLTPEVHVGYSYEYLHEKIQAVSSFSAANTSFTSTGFKPANHTYLGGVGMTYKGLTFDGKDAMKDLPPVDLTVTYDFAAKDHFMSHSALLKGTWRF
jgi:uncharacterized protein with beta-barrel porin domain